MRLFLLLSCVVISVSSRVLAQNASFVVSRSGTTPQIDSAIDFTTDIWSQHLSSSISIKVNIRYTSLIGSTLGISFPNGVKNFSNAPFQNTWYPTCMANAMLGYEVNPGEHDMDIYINDQANWYFGTDGNPGVGQHDFVSVLLHEICHSLGIISLAKSKNGGGSFGELEHSDFFFLPTTFGFFDQEGLPSVYDRYLQNNSGIALTDSTQFDSIQLNSLFTSNQVFLKADSIQHLIGTDTLVKIYAPATFALGSSITHFDESTYNGTANALMTPSIAAREVHHQPGPILSALLYDLGWKYAGQFTGIKPITAPLLQVKVFPNPVADVLTVQLESNDWTAVQLFNMSGETVQKVDLDNLQSGTNLIEIDARHLPIGMYLLVAENQTGARCKELIIKNP